MGVYLLFCVLGTIYEMLLFALTLSFFVFLFFLVRLLFFSVPSATAPPQVKVWITQIVMKFWKVLATIPPDRASALRRPAYAVHAHVVYY